MAHPDLDTLINAVVPFAQRMLTEYGAFLPYGGVLTSEGAVEMIGTGEIEGEPSVEEVYASVLATCRKRMSDGDVAAIALVTDVMTNTPDDDEPSDAVCAHMEHAEGECYDVFLPYDRVEGAPPAFREIFAVDSDAEVFGG